MVGPLVALAEYEEHLARPVDPELQASLDAFAAAVRDGTYNRQGYALKEWKAAGRKASTWAGAESHQTRYRRFLLTGEWGDPEAQEKGVNDG